MLYYKMIAYFKGLRRRLLYKLFEGRIDWKTYENPRQVGGWAGWVELKGECIAFRDTQGWLSFEW